ncbi:MAG: hypothetical protein ACPGSM_01970 [Thiolinea sp.]
MTTIKKILLTTTLLFSAQGVANAGILKATIVEENGGSTGEITWTVLSEQGFVPVLEGKGSSISANLDPGRYIVSVDGDTQGREAVQIDKGIKSIKISTRKFY